ncbi:hypothetical protein QSJ19_09560 [Gordonia sp. ABSL11-1]|uniref:hypothetical protein n=1 Tax=Gordonia sp. ABSL11-1 TaxID=3053924 RepID=UPI002573580F|nr:hypothetical protein [Gordonia sp. ABSL11-1]MDL9945831.1 hypothetical protein [Gordonia sp. ABSL11-1]
MTTTPMATTRHAQSRAEADPIRRGSGRAVVRLSDEDATYWFLHRALGWTVVLQLVWVLDGPVSREALTTMNRELSRGRLHRRVVVPRIPGARPRWERAVDSPDLDWDDRSIPDEEMDTWAAAEMHSVRLDPEQGRCWRLRAGRSDSNRTVVSLCALHLVTDGRTLVQAAADAMTPDLRVGAEQPREIQGRNETRWSSDAADGCRQVLAASRGVAKALYTVVRPATAGDAPDDRPVRTSMSERSPAATWRRATAAVPVQAWDRVATESDGTSNSLFIAVVTGLLRSSGYAPPGETIKVGVPVDRRRGAEDPRSNATAGVSIMISDGPSPGGDLAGIRASCKAAYSRLASGRRPAVAHLQPMVWLLPSTWLVSAATAGSGMPDAMVSNVGDVPSQVMELGGVPASRFAFRGIAQGVDPAAPYRFGDGVQSWLVRTDDTVTMSVFGCDETRFDSDRTLATLLGEELSGWGLPHEIW